MNKCTLRGVITKARQKLNFLSFKDKIMQDFYNSVENYNLGLPEKTPDFGRIIIDNTPIITII